MNKIVKINNCEFVTKSTAMRILGFANHNSIDYLINKSKIGVFEIPNKARKLIPLEDLKKHSRYQNGRIS